MTFCTHCGKQHYPGACYCASCGAPTMPAARSGPGANDPLGVSMNVAALLAYVLLFVSGVFFLAVEPYKRNNYVRFHAFQSIFYSLAYFALAIAHSLLLGLLFAMPVPGLRGVENMVWGLVSLAFVAGWIALMVKAYQNERFMLPLVGPLAAQYAA